jgi:hypothetical protein
MRYLKKLLNSIFLFLAAFTVACFVAWCITREEPTALIAGVFAACGVEIIAGGIIKLMELAKEHKYNKENNLND